MEVSSQAMRIFYTSLGKLYTSRSQKGGLRLHRGLMLIRMIKSSSDIYNLATASVLRAQQDAEKPAAMCTATEMEEDEDTETMEESLTGQG
ncbi:immediate early response gene 2 protein-like [Entelurus aequoreus]|uniref:immediate early response gene 2 protein-like n=1 Tax=Entelurus aequoreus TaxID=161455 RepID=UPI002B1E0B68|nr:immediate early response gene 2 protein-like [Entelurus aequoreus]XP_061892361.1 immediate early response gene 2 protein-like [Entelurus aequoreus]XP_061892362.1 immediate early response gene 2 protein-like [Entelurus aequoreus]